MNELNAITQLELMTQKYQQVSTLLEEVEKKWKRASAAYDGLLHTVDQQAKIIGSQTSQVVEAHLKITTLLIAVKERNQEIAGLRSALATWETRKEDPVEAEIVKVAG